MVDIEKLDLLKQTCGTNWNKYIEEHPGKMVLIVVNKNYGVEELFFRNERKVKKYIKKNNVSSYYDYVRIPTHKNPSEFNLSSFTDKHLIFCPGDNKTKLEGGCCSEREGDNYWGWAKCPDCSYTVRMKPTEKSIEDFKKRMKTIIGGASLESIANHS